MTTDQALFAAIEANPEDSTVKLVYADFLDENGDPRGPGYRAMGHSGKWPRDFPPNRGFDWTKHGLPDSGRLPEEWFDLLEVRGKGNFWAPSFSHRPCDTDPASLRELMDAAALAFARLTPSQQAKYLPKEVIV